MRQPSVTGAIAISRDTSRVIGLLAREVQQVTGEGLSAPTEPWSRSQAIGLLIDCLGALMRLSNSYVARGSWIAATTEQEVNVRFAIPTSNVGATISLLKQLPALLNHPSTRNGGSDALRQVVSGWVKSVQEKLKPLSDQRTNQYRLHEAADALGIPVFRLLPHVDMIGTGRCSRWFNSTITDKTSNLGVQIAKNKFHTGELLRRVGFPGPTHILAEDLEQTRRAAQQLGFPLVIKPNDADRGHGVAADLRTMREVELAYAQAKKHSEHVLVEKWVAGHTHRLTVWESTVVRVTKRIAGGVVGNGVDTVARLVEQVAASAVFQRRTIQWGRAPLTLDEEAVALLDREGRTPAFIPAPGQYVRLRRRDNINAGGTNEACRLGDVHPDNLQLAKDVTGLLRLDFAGIDLIIADITQSWKESDAIICEVNAQPQLRSSDEPLIYQDILGQVFREGAQVESDATVVPDRLPGLDKVAALIAADQRGTIVSSRTGLWRDGQRITSTFEDDYQAAIAALTRGDTHRLHAILSISDVLHYGVPHFTWNSLRFSHFDSQAQDPRIDRARNLIGSYFVREITE